MHTSIRTFALALGLTFMSLFGAAASVHAQTVINSLPYTITTAGTYVLNSNLNSAQTSGNLISVNASNVIIDFQGRYISGPAGNNSLTNFGIRATERSNLTIKNGTVAHCQYGIYIEGNGTATTNSVDHQVDNMRVAYCTYVGIFLVNSPASRITNCQVSQTGYSGASTAYGIAAQSSDTTVSGNAVSGVTASSAYAIFASGGFIRQNTVANSKYGVYGGKYQDNLTSNCTTPYSQGTDAGGNN